VPVFRNPFLVPPGDTFGLESLKGGAVSLCRVKFVADTGSETVDDPGISSATEIHCGGTSLILAATSVIPVFQNARGDILHNSSITSFKFRVKSESAAGLLFRLVILGNVLTFVPIKRRVYSEANYSLST
jgi:hypothetical protein